MTSSDRPGTRGPAEMRPLKITPDFVSTADGSVFMELGGHAGAVLGPGGERGPRVAAGQRGRLADG